MTYEQELVYHQPNSRLATPEQVKRMSFEYIEALCNRRRRQSATGYQSPESFETRLN